VPQPTADPVPADPHRAAGAHDKPAPAAAPTATAAPAPASPPAGGVPAPGGADNEASEDRRQDQPAAPAVAATGPAAPAPTPATAPAAEVTAPAPAQPSTPAAPATQVAMHIVPLRQEADGIHRLTVHLHPVDLGAVSVVAEIRDGSVAVQLSGATEHGRQALHDALPQLRQELADAGFTNCSLDLRQNAPSGGQEYRQPTASRASGPDTTGPASAPAEPEVRPSVDRNRLLDLRV
jgi:flagellar hook-length control protein FliK